MKANSLRQVWAENRCAINGWLSIPSPLTAEAMAAAGWDSLTIDMQHGITDFAAMATMLPAIAHGSRGTGGIDALVRVPWLEEGVIMKTLDAGAGGVICPMVNTRADAERFAAAVRYPPAGARSFGPFRAQLHYGADYYQHADAEVVALAMVETKQAVANAAEILAVDGIDGAYIGPADLACSLDCEPSFTPTAAPVVEAIDEIYAAAHAAGKRVGIHTGSVDYAAAMRAKGFDLVTVLSDFRLMSAGATTTVAALQKKENAK